MAHARNPYLAQHHIPEILDDIVGKLLVLKPHHPLLFLLSECAEAEQERRRMATGVKEGLGNFPDLTNRHSLMAQLLTCELYNNMHNLRTAHGGVLDDIIQLGVDIPEYKFAYSAGCVATDSQSYRLFAPLLNKIIQKLYPDWEPSFIHDTGLRVDLGLASAYFVPNRTLTLGYFCTLSRSVEGCAFPFTINRGDRRIVASAVSKILRGAADSFPGCVYEGEDIKLRSRSLSVEECADVSDAMGLLRGYVLDPPILDSEYDTRLNLSRDWPDGRCVWQSKQSDLAVWTNIHEHIQMRLICEDVNESVAVGVERLLSIGCVLEDGLTAMGCPFDVNQELGAMVSSPAHIGTGFELSVVLRLDRLVRHKRFDQLLDSLKLMCHTVADVVNGTYFGLPVTKETGPLDHPHLSASTVFISNDIPAVVCVQSKKKVGSSIKAVMQHTLAAVQSLSELEESLSRNQSIDDSIMKLNEG